MKTIPLLTILLMTGNVHAEWTLVTMAEGNKIYLDLTTLKQTANDWPIWQVDDLKKPAPVWEPLTQGA